MQFRFQKSSTALTVALLLIACIFPGAAALAATPTLISLSPNSGPTTGGNLLTFTGSNFSGTASVIFPDGSAATNVTIVNSTTVTAIAPAQTAGDVGGGSVSLLINDGVTVTDLSATYTYVQPPAPTFSSMSPNNGTVAGGNLLTFTGTNFAGVATVTFPDGSVATNVTIVNSTTITAIAPAQSAGDIGGGTVTLSLKEGVTVTNFTASYTYVAPPTPTFSSMTPNSGTTAGGTFLTFTGTNFAGSATVTFPDGSPATNVTVVDSTTITAIAPAQTAGDIAGGTVTLSLKEGVTVTNFTATYTYVAPPTPTFSSMSPNSGLTIGESPLTFTGTNFAGVATVTFPDGSPATNVTIVNPTTITAIAPAQTAGDVGGGTVTLSIKEGVTVTNFTATYTYVTPPTPTFSSMSPNSGTTAGGNLLTFTGSNFLGVATVTFPDGSPATNVTIVNSATVTAIAPAQTAGDIGGGTVTLSLKEGVTVTNFTASYTYVAPAPPTLSSMSPNSGTTAGGTLLTFTGTNFAGIATVIFPDGSPATNVTIINSTTITAIAPAQTAGDIGGGTVTLSLKEGVSVTNLTAPYTYVRTIATSTSLTSSANPVAAGAPVTFTATVASGSGTPTGTIVFKDGATILGSAALSGGAASLTTSLMVGTHQITAAYGGNSSFTSSTSAPLTEIVNVSQDSLKLRALQILATKVEAQNSGAAIAEAIDRAISDGFSDGGRLITPGATGIRFNFSADPDQPQAANNGATLSDRWGTLPDNAGSRLQSYTAPGGGRVEDAFAAIDRQTMPVKAQPARYTEPKDWLLWADIQGSGIDHAGSSVGMPQLLYGSQVNALMGLTHKITSTFLVGVLGGYETFDYRSDALNGRLKGDGWTIGSYLGWKFAPGLRFDAAAAYSGIGYDGVAGMASGDFNGHRWLLSTGVTGTYKLYGFAVEPSAKIYALWEQENAYTDSLGAFQADRDFFTGRASTGAKVSYPWLNSASVTIAPYVGLYGDYYFENDNAAAVPLAGAPALASVPLLEGWSMRATGGVAAHLANGANIAVGAEFGGIGSSTQIWTFRGRASVPFN